MRKAKKFDSSSLGSFFAVSELGHKRCTVATRRPEMSFLYLIYIDSGTFLSKKNRRLLSNFYGAVNFLAKGPGKILFVCPKNVYDHFPNATYT